ncbi:MAG: carboxypeptidase regulatory-like domain-containing protein, partial [Gemmatimonadota bacterium]|nr:carboxypeptidase regulatory-like domain-containing protein [Gemmatimonadota bacterium]
MQRINVLSLAMLSFLWVIPTAAQTITGTVTDAVTGRPAGQGFVVLLNDDGREMTRARTDVNGTFVLYAPEAGTFTIRSERIGYRATQSDAFSIQQDAEVTVNLFVSRVPIELGSISVEAEGRCEITPERQAVAAVWNEVRKALEAAVWTAGQQEYDFQMLHFRRDFLADGERILGEESVRVQDIYQMPYRSVEPEYLGRRGYVVEEGGARWYRAPDAEVLLSDEFQSSHCFHVTRDDSLRPGEVGIAFETARTDDRVDVNGTLWVNEQSWELSDLEFQYVGSETARERRMRDLGGTVKFLKLPSGDWIVHEWKVRMPRYEARTEITYGINATDIVFRGYREEGGKVTNITTMDGVPVFEAPASLIAGRIWDRTRGGPLENAVVTVAGTPYQVYSDSTGRFGILAPMEGSYAVVATHPRLDTLNIPPIVATTAIEPGERVLLEFETPTMGEVLSQLCPRGFDETAGRIVVGNVTDVESGLPVVGVSVAAYWSNEPSQLTGSVPPDIRVPADSTGSFVLCGVPIGVEVALRTETDVLSQGTVKIQMFDDRVVVEDELIAQTSKQEYALEDPVWRQNLVVTPADLEATGITISAAVNDATSGAPVALAVISLNGIVLGTTDGGGHFEITTGLAFVGDNRVAVRRMGYAALNEVLSIQPESTSAEFTAAMEPLGIMLPDIVVEGERMALRSPHLRGFYRRRETGGGHFFTAEEIEEMNPEVATDVLRRVPGATVT